MIEFSCACGHRLQTHDSQRGESVTCPACGKRQSVPADEGNRLTTERPTRPTSFAEDAPPRRGGRFDDEPNDRRRPASGGQPKSHALLYTMIALGVCALVACPVLILLGLLLPAVSSVREAAARMQSSNNMKQLALGAINYNDSYGYFPTAYTLVDSGQGGERVAGLGWRVALLPYIEGGPLYNMYVPEQPWDSPVNKSIQSSVVRTYNEPSDTKSANMETFYQVFVTAPGKRPHSAFNHPTDPINKVSLSMIANADGAADTILIAEAPTSVPWYRGQHCRLRRRLRETNFDLDQPGDPQVAHHA